MSEILEGMTREQALGCLVNVYGTEECAFVYNGVAYFSMSDVGLTRCCTSPERHDWGKSINAHYDDLEKPKWVEPRLEHKDLTGLITSDEIFHVGFIGCLSEEVNRTNARRKVEAFIAANGGAGEWLIMHLPEKGFYTEITSYLRIGQITCATRELAEEVIRRFPEQLKLIGGIK